MFCHAEAESAIGDGFIGFIYTAQLQNMQGMTKQMEKTVFLQCVQV